VCLQRSLETQKWGSIGLQAPLKKHEKEKKEEEAEAKKKEEGKELTSSDEANALYCEMFKPII
jgi:hypothetical protein